jgi:hypothetical protein
MKILFAPAGLVLPLMLICSMSDANALTLGRARGAALLGQNLDLSVAAQFGPDEEAVVSCFQAEVFYGDSRQESGKVSVTALPSVGPQSISLRILSEVKVDEPVVTVYLKATCGQKTSRKYVLLADLPSEPASALALPRTTSVLLNAQSSKTDLVVGPSLPAMVASLDAAKPVGPAMPSIKSSANKGKNKSLASNTSGGASKNGGLADESKVSKRSRLKLTPMDGLTERDPVLKSTTELLTVPVEDLQKRVEALATWRALNASAQDVLRDEARMQSLEGEMRSLTAVTAKNRQSLEEITARLAEAEAQRYSNPVVYGLMAALLACFGGMAFLWNRRQSVGDGVPWWGGDSAQESLYEPAPVKPNKLDPVGALNDQAAPSAALTIAPSVAGPASIQTVDIDLDLGVSPAAAVEPQGASFGVPSIFSRNSEYPSISRRDFGASISGVLRSVNTKEMLDIRQQADFFMALGRHEEAVAILETGVVAGAEANPLVYLDLLKLLHTLSRKSEFDVRRDQFNKLFTGLVPPYTSFHFGGNSLEAYPQVCTQISNLWPTSQAIEYIEFCMVRTPTDAPDQGFDLEAFKELLMLDAIAKHLEAPNMTTIAPFSASKDAHPTADLAAGPGPDRFGTPSTVPVPVASSMDARGDTANVDLDLSELDGNLIDFDISNYEKSAGDDPVADSIPDFNVGSSDEPAGRQG